ncbi:MAG: NUDIX domain-containing protein [Elusimicrobiota bacterium]
MDKKIAYEKSCGVIVVFKKNNSHEYLLVQHKALHWGFPKGHINPNETSIETALRELDEETGIKEVEFLQNKPLTEHYEFNKDNVVVKKEVCYFIGIVRTQNVRLQEQELKEFMWCDYKKAFSALTFVEAKRLLGEAEKIIQSQKPFL